VKRLDAVKNAAACGPLRFRWTKKSGLMSPLKTTRYGVSARRPMKEPTDAKSAAFRACNGSNKDVPEKEIRQTR
jgi:hypothetical protein